MITLVALGLVSSESSIHRLSKQDKDARADHTHYCLYPHVLGLNVPVGKNRVDLNCRLFTPAGVQLSRLVKEPSPIDHAKATADLAYAKGADVTLYRDVLSEGSGYEAGGDIQLPDALQVDRKIHEDGTEGDETVPPS